MTDREAIAIIQDDYEYLQCDIEEAKQLAVAAIQEREERNKGCAWCAEHAYFGNLQENGEFLPMYANFCSVCGKRLIALDIA